MSRQQGAPTEVVARLLQSFGLQVVDVTEADAERASAIWHIGTPLCLADRLCLALGWRLRLQVVTADAAWRQLDGGPPVSVIR